MVVPLLSPRMYRVILYISSFFLHSFTSIYLIYSFGLVCTSLTGWTNEVLAEPSLDGCGGLNDNTDESCSVRSGYNEDLPNIIFVLADDLGITDVQYNNASMITPNIAKMAEEGIKLNQNYMQSWCTPSRYSLMTGLYPIHIGKQSMDKGKRYLDPTGCPLKYKLIPEKLKQFGYETHLVGKWDLGYCNEAYTPTKRGFDSFYGFWGGLNDHYTKVRYGVTDWKDGLENPPTYPDQHSSYLFMDRVKSILDENSSGTVKRPIFLVFASPLPHDPFQAPKKYYDMYPHVKNEMVRNRNGLITMLDDTIGNLTQMIENAGMWDNTIFIFSSDNGAFKIFSNEHDKFGMFKGGKADDIHEGGTLVPGFIKSPLLPKSLQSDSLIHVSDWYPTILRMAGVSAEEIKKLKLDGVDQYDTFFNPRNEHDELRKEMVYNIDIIDDNLVGAVRKGWWKFAQDFSDGKFERSLYDLENDPTEKNNLIDENKEKADELILFFQKGAESMAPRDQPLLCSCPKSHPPCDIFSLRTGRPTDCTSCLNADENNSIKSGWCDVEIKSCIY